MAIDYRANPNAYLNPDNRQLVLNMERTAYLADILRRNQLAKQQNKLLTWSQVAEQSNKAKTISAIEQAATSKKVTSSFMLSEEQFELFKNQNALISGFIGSIVTHQRWPRNKRALRTVVLRSPSDLLSRLDIQIEYLRIIADATKVSGKESQAIMSSFETALLRFNKLQTQGLIARMMDEIVQNFKASLMRIPREQFGGAVPNELLMKMSIPELLLYSFVSPKNKVLRTLLGLNRLETVLKQRPRALTQELYDTLMNIPRYFDAVLQPVVKIYNFLMNTMGSGKTSIKTGNVFVDLESTIKTGINNVIDFFKKGDYLTKIAVSGNEVINVLKAIFALLRDDVISVFVRGGEVITYPTKGKPSRRLLQAPRKRRLVDITGLRSIDFDVVKQLEGQKKNLENITQKLKDLEQNRSKDVVEATIGILSKNKKLETKFEETLQKKTVASVLPNLPSSQKYKLSLDKFQRLKTISQLQEVIEEAEQQNVTKTEVETLIRSLLSVETDVKVRKGLLEQLEKLKERKVDIDKIATNISNIVKKSELFKVQPYLHPKAKSTKTVEQQIKEGLPRIREQFVKSSLQDIVKELQTNIQRYDKTIEQLKSKEDTGIVSETQETINEIVKELDSVEKTKDNAYRIAALVTASGLLLSSGVNIPPEIGLYGSLAAGGLTLTGMPQRQLRSLFTRAASLTKRFFGFEQKFPVETPKEVYRLVGKLKRVVTPKAQNDIVRQINKIVETRVKEGKLRQETADKILQQLPKVYGDMAGKITQIMEEQKSSYMAAPFGMKTFAQVGFVRAFLNPAMISLYILLSKKFLLPMLKDNQFVQAAKQFFTKSILEPLKRTPLIGGVVDKLTVVASKIGVAAESLINGAQTLLGLIGMLRARTFLAQGVTNVRRLYTTTFAKMAARGGLFKLAAGGLSTILGVASVAPMIAMFGVSFASFMQSLSENPNAVIGSVKLFLDKSVKALSSPKTWRALGVILKEIAFGVLRLGWALIKGSVSAIFGRSKNEVEKLNQDVVNTYKEAMAKRNEALVKGIQEDQKTFLTNITDSLKSGVYSLYDLIKTTLTGQIAQAAVLKDIQKKYEVSKDTAKQIFELAMKGYGEDTKEFEKLQKLVGDKIQDWKKTRKEVFDTYSKLLKETQETYQQYVSGPGGVIRGIGLMGLQMFRGTFEKVKSPFEALNEKFSQFLELFALGNNSLLAQVTEIEKHTKDIKDSSTAIKDKLTQKSIVEKALDVFASAFKNAQNANKNLPSPAVSKPVTGGVGVEKGDIARSNFAKAFGKVAGLTFEYVNKGLPFSKTNINKIFGSKELQDLLNLITSSGRIVSSSPFYATRMPSIKETYQKYGKKDPELVASTITSELVTLLYQSGDKKAISLFSTAAIGRLVPIVVAALGFRKGKQMYFPDPSYVFNYLMRTFTPDVYKLSVISPYIYYNTLGLLDKSKKDLPLTEATTKAILDRFNQYDYNTVGKYGNTLISKFLKDRGKLSAPIMELGMTPIFIDNFIKRNKKALQKKTIVAGNKFNQTIAESIKVTKLWSSVSDEFVRNIINEITKRPTVTSPNNNIVPGFGSSMLTKKDWESIQSTYNYPEMNVGKYTSPMSVTSVGELPNKQIEFTPPSEAELLSYLGLSEGRTLSKQELELLIKALKSSSSTSKSETQTMNYHNIIEVPATYNINVSGTTPTMPYGKFYTPYNYRLNYKVPGSNQ